MPSTTKRRLVWIFLASAMLLMTVGAAGAVCWAYGPFSRLFATYYPSQVRVAAVSEVRFYCPKTGRSLVISDADRLKQVEAAYGLLSRSREARLTLPDRVPGGSVPVAGVVRFRDGGSMTGYWTISVSAFFVMYQPNGTWSELDPGAYWQPATAQDDEQNLSLLRELMSLCEEEEKRKPPVEAPR